jgi:hypothetical protein
MIGQRFLGDSRKQFGTISSPHLSAVRWSLRPLGEQDHFWVDLRSRLFLAAAAIILE